MAITTAIATIVATGLIRNITAAQARAPTNETLQWTRNVGRNDGLRRNRSPAETKLTTA